jgi:hypothetical protein
LPYTIFSLFTAATWFSVLAAFFGGGFTAAFG